MKSQKNNRILVVAAHPDDEILGCGGTIAKLVDDGYEAYTLILGEGITSRDDKRNPNQRKDEIESLRKNIHEANQIVGVQKVYTRDLPDNRFDSIDLLDIIKIVEEIKNMVEPEIIFTHYGNDLNIDHKITSKAVLTATRPLEDETASEIYSFEVLSSTEWQFPNSFSPDTYFKLDEKYVNIKKEAMNKYETETRKFPHPRSVESIQAKAKNRGTNICHKYAESFKSLRVIK